MCIRQYIGLAAAGYKPGRTRIFSRAEHNGQQSVLVIDSSDGVLVLHTSRQRYLTRDDNLRHQSNFTAKISTPEMRVLWQSGEFPGNHVSHSFAQYVVFDNGTPVCADHGDAYPRGFTLNVETGQDRAREQNFFPFSGAIGDNTTNAVPGGLGVSASSYLFLGASSPQEGGDSLKKANAFLAVIPKSGGQAQIQWLTSLPAGGQDFVNDVRLVQVNNNTFVAMWQVTHPGKNFYRFDELQYAVFNGQGQQVGVAGDNDNVWTTFHSGVSLKAQLDSSGNPAMQVQLPFWLR